MHAGWSGLAGDGWRQPLLIGERSLAVSHGFLVVRISHVGADSIRAISDSSGINGHRISLPLHFAAIGAPLHFRSVLGIEVRRRDSGAYRLARKNRIR